MEQTSGFDAVVAALSGEVAALLQRCIATMTVIGARLELWAKTEHTFTNRTGNTANSIQGFVAEVTPELVRTVLSAGMEYDVFLELARDGKWAFLMPVIEKHKDEILQLLAEGLGTTPTLTVAPSETLTSDYETFKTSVRDSKG